MNLDAWYDRDSDYILDSIFRHFDDLFEAGNFDEADQLLNDIDTSMLSVLHSVGVLSATYPAKDRLPSRQDLYIRVKERFQQVVPERAIALLQGLE